MQETCRLGRFQVLFFSFLLTAEVYAELFLFPIICAVPSLHRRERQYSSLRTPVPCAPAAACTAGGAVSAAGAFPGLPVPDHAPDRKAYCQHQDCDNHKINEIGCKP